MKDLVRGLVFIGIFAVPFIPLIIANSLFFPFITGKNFAFRIIVEIILAAWVVLALYEPRYRPKFSWILAAFVSLLVVMFFANLFGEYPLKSFWSNFERMEGYVTLAHVFAYLLVVGSVITTEKLWNRLLNTALISAVILSLYAFAQLSGNITINQGGWRLDGTLGNSAYMAIYMLFHVFIAGLMLVRTESRNLRFMYAALVALFVYLLVQTATRGTILGLFGGSAITVIYIALFAKQYPSVRKIALGGLIALVVFVSLFVAFKEASFIQGNKYLSRVANITLDEATARFDVWSISFNGIKERPILGWGQGNYNYVFNQYYKPSLYDQESWFDRVHNIVLDWLIAGGVLGLIAYFSILFAALYYLFLRPLLRKDESFTVMERGVLIGLLAGYVFHNLFVFDNIVSYIYYGTILAFIHSRVAVEIPRIQNWSVDKRVVDQVVAPVMIVVLAGTLYFVNMPGLRAAGDIIDAFVAVPIEDKMTAFDRALARNSFADQEIREQMTRLTQGIIRDSNAPGELKQRAFKRTEEELLQQTVEKPGDARVHVFISSFYRMTNNIGPAIEQLEIARSLSPEKQQIIFEQGLARIQNQEFDIALDLFREAYELAPAYDEARIFYATAALFAGKPEVVDEVIDTQRLMEQFAQNNLAVQAAYTSNESELLKRMFETRIGLSPQDPQFRVNLAVIYQEQGDIEKAIEILEQAAVDIPSFKDQSEQFVADLKAGRAPGEPQVNSLGAPVESHPR